MSEIDELVAGLTPEDLGDAFSIGETEWKVNCGLAQILPFSAAGYKAHYIAIFRMAMPEHAEKWVDEVFREYEHGRRRFLVKGHRGSTKSTVWTIGFASYVLAKFPSHGVLIVQKGDEAGAGTAGSIARIIEFNEGWKLAYPQVVPDKEVHWSPGSGFEVKRTDVPYEEWRQTVLKERPKDPSFVGLGWSSSRIVGMHPLWLFIDDIHDKENTRSDREMSGVLETLKSNILQTLKRPPGAAEPVCLVSYTPWSDKDSYAYLESTGLYYQITTPIITPAEKGSKGSFDWNGKCVRLTWARVADPVKYLEDAVREAGPIDFATQMLLDLSAAKGKTLKLEWLHEYPLADLRPGWPCYLGVDYASTMDKIRDKDRDYFSVAFVRVIPGLGGVLWDGYRDKISRAEAKIKVMALYDQFQPAMIGIEKLGKGEEFFVDMMATGLPIMGVPRAGDKALSKGEKFEGTLAKFFYGSQLFVGDRQTEFLKVFKDEWVSWDGTQKSHDDTLDSCYVATYCMQGQLIAPRHRGDFAKEKVKKGNPYNSLGDNRR